MNKSFLIFILLFINSLTFSQKIELKSLEGKWFIVQTNFPMWLKGDKTNPTFNYSIIEKGEKQVLFDEVKYLKNQKEKSIVGFDKAIDDANTSFIWKGKGILSLLKSKWKILYLDSSAQWAIIQFEKTLFTPKGYDVIARNKAFDEDKIKSKLNELGVLKEAKLSILK